MVARRALMILTTPSDDGETVRLGAEITSDRHGSQAMLDSKISGNRIELFNYDRVDRDAVNLAVGLARLFRITRNQGRYVRVLPRLVADAIGQFL